jgi:hypothetical protein
MNIKTKPTKKEIDLSFLALNVLSHKKQPPPRQRYALYERAKARLLRECKSSEEYEREHKRVVDLYGI